MNALDYKEPLDPIMDAASWFREIDEKDDEEYGAIIVATNGDFRFAEAKEAYDIVEKLGEDLEVEIIGNSDYVMFFHSKNILKAKGDKYFVGSCLVVKLSDECIELVTRDEGMSIREKFGGHLAVLKAGKSCYFTAYPLD